MQKLCFNHSLKKLSENALKNRYGVLRFYINATILWFAYYFLVFTVGRDPSLIGYVTWGGLLLPAYHSIQIILRHGKSIPFESIPLFTLVGWVSLQAPFVPDLDDYLTYYRFLLQFALIVFALSLIVKKSGYFELYFWTIAIVSLINFLFGIQNGIDQYLTPGNVDRATALFNSPNLLGTHSMLGVIGSLSLLGYSDKSKALKLLLIFICIFSFLSLIASASRGSFVGLIIFMIYWIVLLQMRHRMSLSRILIIWILVFTIAYIYLPMILDNTNMGRRLLMASEVADGSSDLRFKLIWAGIVMAIDYPILGAGLGQFPTASGTGMMAHSEWSEILGTTGIIGFIIYISAYYHLWVRLNFVLKSHPNYYVYYWTHIARACLITLTATGAWFRPNFAYHDTWFLLAVCIGIGLWGRDQVRLKNT